MNRSFKAVYDAEPGCWVVRHPELHDCHFGIYDSRREAHRQARALRREERWQLRRFGRR